MKTFIATYLLDKEGDLSKTDKPMVEKIRDKIEYVFDKANDYERIKEKLIGETFEYVPEFSYIINGILMRYENNPDLIRFLRENTNYIISTFNKSGTRNLRILKHALNDFKKIYEMVNKYYPNTNYRVLQTMLIFTIAISFEIKAGKITKDKFINIKDNEEYKSILVSSRVLMDNRQFYIKEFDNNYYYNFKTGIVSTNIKEVFYVIDNWNDTILKYDDLAGYLVLYSNNVSIKIRVLLQYYGTNIIRNHFWKEAFIRYTMNKAFDIRNSKGQCIISDARFEDECMAIKYYGGKIIRVDRRVNNDNHESEQIKISQDDYVIDNTGTLVGLFYKVLKFVTDYMV